MVLSLIGYRGSGKSTVARLLASAWDWPWQDADAAIEALAGQSIAMIFAEHGEAAFRELETRVLRELVRQDRLVLAAGGGAVLRPENRELLRAAGKVAWLRADAATLLARLEADAASTLRRPPLTDLAPAEEIAILLSQREPLYRQCADVVVETAGKPAERVAAELAELLSVWRQGGQDGAAGVP
ncbi:MAG: shikimate kinase [Pirellulales bacterium]|nr:shikimate kinase [Pirellulales bacterium]